MGPPMRVKRSWPSGMTERTIAPSVSTWAERPTVFSLLLPSMVMTPQPLRVISKG